MKKATELKNWLSKWWERQIKKETINLKENEESIMTLLTWCNGSRLTTEERILLFSTIRNKFENIIDNDEISTTNTLKAIKEFKGKEPIKTVVKDPVFEKSLNEINVDYEFVKAN